MRPRLDQHRNSPGTPLLVADRERRDSDTVLERQLPQQVIEAAQLLPRSNRVMQYHQEVDVGVRIGLAAG